MYISHGAECIPAICKICIQNFITCSESGQKGNCIFTHPLLCKDESMILYLPIYLSMSVYPKYFSSPVWPPVAPLLLKKTLH